MSQVEKKELRAKYRNLRHYNHLNQHHNFHHPHYNYSNLSELKMSEAGPKIKTLTSQNQLLRLNKQKLLLGVGTEDIFFLTRSQPKRTGSETLIITTTTGIH